MITLKPPFRANNMEGLFKKVSKGLYHPIPKTYSTELSNLVRALLKANPDKRPTCEEILQMSSIRKKISLYFPGQDDDFQNSELLKTIVFPKNLMYLTSQLPKPSYDEDEEVDVDFEEHIKSSTLPHKPRKKRSDDFSNQRVLSRAKASKEGVRSRGISQNEYLGTYFKTLYPNML